MLLFKIFENVGSFLKKGIVNGRGFVISIHNYSLKKRGIALLGSSLISRDGRMAGLIQKY